MARGPTMFDKMDFPKYIFREYPKVLYAKGRTTIVHSAEGEEKLVGNWYTTQKEAANSKDPVILPDSAGE